MTIRDLVPEIKGEIKSIIAERNLDLSIDLGYEIRKTEISGCYGENKMITIYPNVNWTDGTIKPAWSSGYVCFCVKE